MRKVVREKKERQREATRKERETKAAKSAVNVLSNDNRDLLDDSLDIEFASSEEEPMKEEEEEKTPTALFFILSSAYSTYTTNELYHTRSSKDVVCGIMQIIDLLLCAGHHQRERKYLSW